MEPPRSLGELVPYVPPSVPDKRGRRSSYTLDIGLEICLRLSEGQTLRRICRDPTLPDFRTVMNWLHYAKRVSPQIAEFRKMHKRARIAQMHAWSDEIIEIADDGTNDWYEEELESGRVVEKLNHEHIARSKLRIDTRLRLMGNIARNVFGTSKEAIVAERMEEEAAKSDAPTRELTEREKLDRARRVAFIMGQAGVKVGAKKEEDAPVVRTVTPRDEDILAPGEIDDGVDEDWFGEE